jgi:hypothetical protein
VPTKPRIQTHKGKLRLVSNNEEQRGLTFVNACHLDGEDLHVDFSDGTTAQFKAHELAMLRPERTPWDFGE